jgi:hypothetical protein
MSSSALSIWGSTGLGSFVSFRDGAVLFEFVVGLPGFVGISGSIVAKFLLLFCLAGSGIGMFRLLESVVASNTLRWKYQCIGPLIGALLYMASPYQFDQIIAGDLGGLVAYAILPFAIRRLLQASGEVGGDEVRRKVAYIAIISGFQFGVAFACSTQPTLLAAIIVVLLAAATFSHRANLILSVVIVAGVAILTNSYWLAVGLLSGHVVSTASTLTNTSLVSAAYSPYNSVNATIQGWSYVVTFFWNGLGGFLQRLWSAAVDSLLVTVFIGTLISSRISPRDPLHRLGRICCLLFPLAVLFAIPANKTFGALDRFLYSFHLFTLLFRTPQHLVYPVALIAAMLAGLGIALIQRTLGGGHSRRILAAWTSILAALGVFIASGFMMSSSLTNYLGPHPITSSESAVYDYLNSHGSSQGREIFLPGGPDNYFYSTGPGNFTLDAGNDGDVTWSKHSPIATDALWNPLSSTSYLQLAASSELLSDPQNGQGLLTLLSVQYVVISPFYSSGAGPLYEDWNPAFAYSQIRHVPGLKLVLQRHGWYVFQNERFRGQVLPVTMTSKSVGPLLSTMISAGPSIPNLVVAKADAPRGQKGTNSASHTTGFDRATIDEDGPLAPLNWVAESAISGQVWNYFLGLDEGYMSLDAPNGDSNALNLGFKTQPDQRYKIQMAILAPGRGWRLTASLNRRRLPLLIGRGTGSTQFRSVDLGTFRLPRNSTLSVNVKCDGCFFAVLGAVAVRPPMKPTCSVSNAAMSSASRFTSNVTCQSEGSIVLSDSYSANWHGVATGKNGRTFSLSHVEVDGAINGWRVPVGSWRVTLDFGPQSIYEWSLIVWTAIIICLILCVMYLRRAPTEHGRKRFRRNSLRNQSQSDPANP